MKNILLIACFLYFSQLSAQINLADGLMAVYEFTNDANDFSGNNRHGLLLGNSTANGVLSCGDNNQDGLSIPHSVLNELVDFSIGFDIKFDVFHGSVNESGKTNIIFSGWREDGVNPPDNELNIDYLKHGISGTETFENAFRVYLDDVRYTFYNVNLNVDTWYTIVIRRSSGILELFIDQVQIGPSLTTTNQPILVKENGLIIGQEQDILGGNFKQKQCMAGQMDNLCFYDRGLTQDEINSIFQNNHQELVFPINNGNSNLAEMLQVYPIPYSFEKGGLNIKNDHELKIETIKVINIFGQLLHYHKIESDQDLIIIDPLTNSLISFHQYFFLEIVLEDGRRIVQKILQETF